VEGEGISLNIWDPPRRGAQEAGAPSHEGPLQLLERAVEEEGNRKEGIPLRPSLVGGGWEPSKTAAGGVLIS
jgi:hypothetical protein